MLARFSTLSRSKPYVKNFRSTAQAATQPPIFSGSPSGFLPGINPCKALNELGTSGFRRGSLGPPPSRKTGCLIDEIHPRVIDNSVLISRAHNSKFANASPISSLPSFVVLGDFLLRSSTLSNSLSNTFDG